MANQMKEIENNGITPYLKRFLNWSASKNYSQATIKTREVCINRFITWCSTRGLDQPQDVTKPVLERYGSHLSHYRKPNGQLLSFSTQHSLLTPLMAFFKWLNRENYILYNPASDFELPRVPKHLPKDFLSYDEIEDMLRHTQIYGDLGVRDRAIIETFYSSGIRRMELVNLKLQDFDPERGTLVIFEGKWKKDRIVPIGDRACAWVQKYLAEIRPSLVTAEDKGYIFLTEYGEPFVRNRITDLIKKYLVAAGIEKPGACQLFRRSMATHMLDNGADIRYIQKILGHVNLTSTQIYTQVSIRKLKQVHSQTHPAKLVSDRAVREDQP
ncbi:MAG: site-specific tyrosine recombinase XerC [Candidatus Thiodiazotropha sp. (ex Lucinoma borealis)]|nr:site-specific tyrosine recombinase XerC [Candidatus Thiodiazotropha sp. (ex Lucinoma borealis)]